MRRFGVPLVPRGDALSLALLHHYIAIDGDFGEAGPYELYICGFCPGDVARNGSIAFNDLLALLSMWGPSCPPAPECCPADLDHNGVVDFADLLILLSLWGGC